MLQRFSVSRMLVSSHRCMCQPTLLCVYGVLLMCRVTRVMLWAVDVNGIIVTALLSLSILLCLQLLLGHSKLCLSNKPFRLHSFVRRLVHLPVVCTALVRQACVNVPVWRNRL